ncbi:hypothetical protein A8B82_12315 [Sulfitobacter sp. EhC04]|uniref:DUF1127 domain-containing protein n=1 Tax=Sulfitobacter sp. EhC04 TaxID=1849168 RepID=UPI0007F499F0|nr:DUF1127 domain-containing protein [Sulfitobacter sp. EhC04]OAN77689.1 hypothetical protein A8B82_12315 [Sulfitobacter sp. EhC04]
MAQLFDSASGRGRAIKTRRSSLWAGFLRLRAIARSRRRLGQLDNHLLQDIGVNRTEAQKEARRPPWDVPAHWLSGR